jgi:uncharacterized protein (TIGR02099 family)
LHKVWVALAICLVLLATVVSILRLALPYADSYKQQIERVLSSQLGATVAIGQISAEWRSSGPALLLQQLALGDPQQPVLTIAQTSLHLDFWQTLLQRTVTAEQIELQGLRYQLNADQLLGKQSSAASNELTLSALEQLFFRQLKDFTVIESQLVLISAEHPEQALQIHRLNWRNAGERHQGHGELSIAGVTANTISFILDFQGPDLQQAQGQLYLESAELDVLPWFAQLLPQSSRLQKAAINFRAWAGLSGRQLNYLQLELAENSLHWQREGGQHSLKLGPGQLLWTPNSNGWQLLSTELTLADALTQWPGLTLQLSRADEQYLATLSDFQLDALQPLAQLLAEDSEKLEAILAYEPAGYLQQLQLRVRQEQWQLTGKVEALSTAAVGDVPGVKQLQVQLAATENSIWLRLSGEQQSLDWDGLFLSPWDYHQLVAELRLVPTAAGWQIQIPEFKLQLSDFELAAEANIALGEQPELALLARLTGLDAAKASQYFPQRYMPQKPRDYLSSAIEGGQLRQATVLWQGAFADYPFSDGTGHFQVYAGLQGGTFRFAPNWPALTELQAALWFDNAAMLIEGQQGYLGLLPLTDPVQASIVDLRKADQLDIRLNTELDTAALTELMLASSLRNSLGKTLQYLGLAGPVRGDLLLEVGLAKPSVVASGSAELLNVQANLRAPAIQLDGLTGRVNFRNEALAGEALQFRYLGLPASGRFNGAMQDLGYQIDLTLQGQALAEDLQLLLATDNEDLLAGVADWQLRLALNLPEQGFNYQAALDADLSALALQLPKPYQKSAGQRALLHLVANGNTEQSFVALSYPQLLDFQAQLSHSTGRIERAQLMLGSDKASLTQAGFTVEVDLASAELTSWFSLLQPLLSKAASEPGWLPPLQRVRGQIQQILLPGELGLTNTVFDLTPTTDAWQLQLNGAEIASRWQFFRDWQAKGLTADLDYLHLVLPPPLLAADRAAVETTPPEPEPLVQHWLLDMVPLQLRCKDCAVGPYRFGKVLLKAAGTGERWQLTELQTDYKGNKFNLMGNWQPDAELGLSQFSGNFFSPNLGALLSEYGLSTAIRGSRSELDFTLHWQGAPQQFAMKALNGKVQFALGEGSLTEVSDQGARLFSIFSLNSLLRKLRLDFRDVFAKGFFYNRMSGNLSLQQGVAQTSDFSIDGVPGNMQLQGYADLVKRELDYQVSFSPKVTSSLPVIIAWMVNPATGLAALALDEVFQSAEVISRINFTVTGSFDKPVVTEVNRHSTEVPVPVRLAQPEIRNDDSRQPLLN